MNKRFILIMALFSAALLPSPATSGQTVPGPKMVIVEKEFDFKEVLEGKMVVHTFKVLNEGDQPLQIQAVRPG
jgi:hypothetical protein